MTYEWQEYSRTIHVDRMLAMDLLRVKTLMEYEDTWIEGKPLGNVKRKSEMPLFYFERETK